MEEKTIQIPVTINEENGTYWGEAILFDGCFSSGESLEEYGKNMTDAIADYSDGIKEGFFDVPNTGILNIKLNNDGRIKSSFLKRINKNSYKALSGSQEMKV